MPYRIAIVDDRPQNLVSLSEKIVFSGEVIVLFTAQRIHGKAEIIRARSASTGGADGHRHAGDEWH
jgi:hypothetical protein